MANVTICPFAEQRILHPEAETAPVIRPNVFVLHTFGFNAKAEAIGRYFDQESVGVESTFAIDEDGTLYQFMPVDRQADAQAGGNKHAVSCETWDGGKPETPLNEKQMATMVRLLVWLHKEWGIQLVQSQTANGPGCAWHSKYPSWNPNKHACPGPVRIKQFVEQVLPRARAATYKVTPVARTLKVVVVKVDTPEHRLLAGEDYPLLFGSRSLWLTSGGDFEVGPGVDAVGFGVKVSVGRSYVGADRYETLRLALEGEK